MKEVLIGLIAIAFISIAMNHSSTIVNPMDLSDRHHHDDKHSNSPSTGQISPPSQHIHKHPDPEPHAKSASHLNQLSPEIKQAIKEKLYHHNPKEAITDSSGGTLVPFNGKYTQMPVAVEMPDGSIQIREYSVIPESQ